MIKKTKLYIDADDTILNSSETIVSMLNEKYDIQPPKTWADATDWNYKNIYSGMTEQKVVEMYESEEFFERLDVMKGFDSFLGQLEDYIKVVVVTKGTPKNIELKKQFFENRFDDFEYCGIEFGSRKDFDKSNINMKGGIQIDDRIDCLRKTNAGIKILITHGLNRYWNTLNEHISNLYIVENWQQAAEVVWFAVNNKWFLENIE